MSALLILVAVLQYHWTNEVSAASKSRIRIDLESSMATWRFDLYHEFSAICVALQVGPDSGARDTWNDYVQRYSDWSLVTSSPDSVESVYRNPDLVKDVYAWEPADHSLPQLQLLNKTSHRKRRRRCSRSPKRGRAPDEGLKAIGTSLDRVLLEKAEL